MNTGTWSLEVIRGNEVGRRYPLSADSTVLGNQVNQVDGIDLAHQEAGSLRKMAGRQAVIEKANHGYVIRDLSSPGGTFLNRQRLIPSQPKPLVSGDLIQLGGVQLRLVLSPAMSSVASATHNGPIHLELSGGVVCRTWDEILTLSAHKWTLLVDELVKGRLDAFVRSIGQPQLAVAANGSPDERLDDWLSRIPASRSNSPILDAIHPSMLTIKAASGGGRTSRKITISNVGYRVLKVEPRIEPEVDWLKLSEDSGKGPISVIDSTTLTLDVIIPEKIDKPLRTTLQLRSNGGTQEVSIGLEPNATRNPLLHEPTVRPPREPSLSRVSLPSRIARFTLVAFAARMLVTVSDAWLSPADLPGKVVETPQLIGPLLAFGALGGVFGLALGMRARFDDRAIVPNSVTIACAFFWMGIFLSTILVAFCRAVEPHLGLIGQSRITQPLLWAAFGTLLALLSWPLIPYSQRKMSA